MQDNVNTLLYNGFIEELVDILEVKNDHLMVRTLFICYANVYYFGFWNHINEMRCYFHLSNSYCGFVLGYKSNSAAYSHINYSPG